MAPKAKPAGGGRAQPSDTASVSSAGNMSHDTTNLSTAGPKGAGAKGTGMSKQQLKQDLKARELDGVSTMFDEPLFPLKEAKGRQDPWVIKCYVKKVDMRKAKPASSAGKSFDMNNEVPRHMRAAMKAAGVFLNKVPNKKPLQVALVENAALKDTIASVEHCGFHSFGALLPEIRSG